MTLLDIIRRFRRGFVLAISLAVIEKLAWIIEPTAFGRLIDSLIAVVGSKERISYALPLMIWIAVFSVNSGVGALRRSFDTKIYLKMFSKIAVHVAESSRTKGLDTARIAARVELSREYVSFLQRRVPDFVEQFFDLVGTITALAFYDHRISLTCFGIVVPLFIISRLYNRRVLGLQAELHDMREDLYPVFKEKDLAEVKAYYEKQAAPQIKIANWGALNFGVLRFFLLGIFLTVLYIAIDIDEFSTGQIYSVVAYLWTFVTSTEYLPDLMESYTSLKDVQRRVRSDNEIQFASEGQETMSATR